MKRLRYRAVAVVVAALCGCVASGTGLHRLGDVAALPRDARIGLVEFRKCGAGYLDRLNPEYYEQDRNARFLLTCTELGHPRTFSDALRQRIEQRLGKKLTRVRSDKTFSAKVVLRDAEKLGLDYVLGGDLLAMGDSETEALVSTQFFVVRVADRKVVLQGMVRKTGARGRIQNIIDEVADELFEKAFVE
jgi:hypothetical protein